MSQGRSWSALTKSAFSGNRPSRAGDLSVETQGIAPIPEEQRYGTPGRLVTVWFAPQVNMAGVFTGALAIVLGLGLWLGLLAMMIGTVLGALLVAYLSTWGPRTGPVSCRMHGWPSAAASCCPQFCNGCRRSPGPR
jgi:NCS1 family nucleobase:cation symporter-1